MPLSQHQSLQSPVRVLISRTNPSSTLSCLFQLQVARFFFTPDPQTVPSPSLPDGQKDRTPQIPLFSLLSAEKTMGTSQSSNGNLVTITGRQFGEFYPHLKLDLPQQLQVTSRAVH
jgi:hypothetical protein